MGKPRQVQRSLEKRLILIFMLIMTILIGSGSFIFYQKASLFFRANQANSLVVLAKLASSQIDAEQHQAVFQANKEDTPAYRNLQKTLVNFRKADPNIRFVYTMVPTKDENWKFVVDAEPTDSEDHSAIGSDFSDGTPNMQKALEKPQADDKFMKDEFGTWISGYAPIQNSEGQTLGILGLDISAKTILDQERALLFIAIAIFLLSLLTSFLASAWFVRTMILAPIKTFLPVLEGMGQGDLSHRLQAKTKDEFGLMFRAFNACIDGFGGIISSLANNTIKISQASGDLTGVSEQMSNDSKLLSDKSTSIASAAEEMSATILSISATAKQASGNIEAISAATTEMTQAMGEIAADTDQAHHVTQEAVSSIQNANNKVDELGTSAKEIDEIVEMIVEISEQTKLLALNATIEAARAGEAGKGFAVVANEVKELAKQTNAASENIRQKIEGIQNSTQHTVSEIEHISAIVHQIDGIIANISTTVEHQAGNAREISDNIGQTALGFKDMTHSISQVAMASGIVASDISEVSSTSQQMASASTSINRQAVELATMSGTLKQEVNRFKL